MAPSVSMLGIHLMTLPLVVRSISHDHLCIHLRTVMFGPLSVTDAWHLDLTLHDSLKQ